MSCTCDCHTVRDTTPADIKRFWAKVNISAAGECWNWEGFINPKGYGQWTRTTGSSGVAHRWAYIFTNGSIPEGMVIDHMCFNRACVNPVHLRLATPAENSQNREGGTSRNTSGHRGVTWHAKAKKWQAKAMKEGKYHSAGLYVDLDEAAAAAEALRARLYNKVA